MFPNNQYLALCYHNNVTQKIQIPKLVVAAVLYRKKRACLSMRYYAIVDDICSKISDLNQWKELGFLHPEVFLLSTYLFLLKI